MKLFFATNSETYKTENKNLLEVSINSALKNTDFEVFLIFDGNKNELNLPKEVTVIEHRHRCYSTFLNYDDNIRIASGAFLRTEIPFLIKSLGYEDNFSLYCDYDVILQKKDFSELHELNPRYFAASTEFGKTNWSYINTGVMLMNINNLFNDDKKILNYIEENIESLDVFDQTLYNNLYQGKIDKLPITYNWKPYWGINDNAKIIHFHGIKPLNEYKNIDKTLLKYYIDNKLSYEYYEKIFKNYKKF